MATVKQWTDQLWQRQGMIAAKFGSDISTAPKTDRVLNRSLLLLLGLVVKVLIDKGVVTEVDLLSALDSARDDTYADLASVTAPPSPVPTSGAVPVPATTPAP